MEANEAGSLLVTCLGLVTAIARDLPAWNAHCCCAIGLL